MIHLTEDLVYVKVHKTEEDESGFGSVVAVCDKDLLGRTFRENEVILTINAEFFEGFLTTLDEALEYIRRAAIAVLVGEKAVSKAVSEGLVHPEAVLTVEGIPHAQIVKV
ncbi:MAG: hypothetical protein B7O98_02185 [Zestosphaera tikiterensis]|uniref:DUF424 domain-containing protein n=1 Tax=Zestosphaera tikiterensis TaxID=1973259 RepID=A0A2R7Y6V1_9CREN|nr:MAG: hypothetical protein B7O98_02185 [Zestosphaera tikiterensis]